MNTYYMAGNKTCDEVESVIISIDTDSGIQGWGDVAQFHIIYQRTLKELQITIITELAPVIIGLICWTRGN